MAENNNELLAEIANPKFAAERTNTEPKCFSLQTCKNCIFDGDCEIQKTERECPDANKCDHTLNTCRQCNTGKHVPSETSNTDTEDSTLTPHPDEVVCPSPAEPMAGNWGACIAERTNVEDCEHIEKPPVPDTNAVEDDTPDADVKEAAIHCKMLKGEIPSNLVMNPTHRNPSQFKVDPTYAGVPNDELWNAMRSQDTMNYDELPRMSDTIGFHGIGGMTDNENLKVTVGDIYESELKRYAKVNAACKIKCQYGSTNSPKAAEKVSPEKSLLKMCNDLPAKMVDTIITTPANFWNFEYNPWGNMSITHDYGCRMVRIDINLAELKKQVTNAEHEDGNHVVSLTYNKRFEAMYVREFARLKDLYEGECNTKRFYQWLGKLIGKIFK